MLVAGSYPHISVVIPTHNEAPNLEYVLPHVPSYVDEVVLVDGHSTDGTIAVARQLMPNIRFIEQADYGKGDALRLGFAQCTGDIIIMIDADGSIDPREMDRFIELLLAGHDFVKGSRFLPGGGSDDMSFLRSIGNSILCDLVNVLFYAEFSDLCYGYMAFWRRCLDDLRIDCTGFQVEALINLRMLEARAKIAEVPSFEHRRIHGQSNLRTFRDGWLVLRAIVDERFRRKPAPRLKRVLTPSLSLLRAHDKGINTQMTARLSRLLQDEPDSFDGRDNMISLDRPDAPQLPIVMYHSIADDAKPRFKQFAVPPRLFADHMAFLDDQGYTPLTITQYIHLRQQPHAVWPNRPIILTFDDGFDDFYTHAFPVLRCHGFVATLYVTTGFVGATSRWLRRSGEAMHQMLTWDHLRELSQNNIECGAHSHNHLPLDTLPLTLARQEIQQSKQLLEKQLSREVLTFAYPFGYYTSALQEEVCRAGFTSACAVKNTLCTGASNPYALERLIVRRDVSVEALEALLARKRDLSYGLYSKAHAAWNFCRRESGTFVRTLKGVAVSS